MEEILDFLTDLYAHNDRAWFQAHKERYQQAERRFLTFTEELVRQIARYDESVATLTPKECTYRIYRDTRFSADKRPYKCHMGAFVTPGGKKSGYAGYYFQVGAMEGDWPDGSLLAAGNYCFPPEVLQILREDICNGDGDFHRLVEQAPRFQLDCSDALKRNPKGFPADAPWPQYLRLRTYCLMYQPPRPSLLSPHLAEEVAEAFRPTAPFVHYLNRAIRFSRGV